MRDFFLKTAFGRIIASWFLAAAFIVGLGGGGYLFVLIVTTLHDTYGEIVAAGFIFLLLFTFIAHCMLTARLGVFPWGDYVSLLKVGKLFKREQPEAARRR